MCEHCSTGTGWTEPFSQEAGICEYAPEPEKGSELPDMCPNYPVAWAFLRFVEDHLCDRHMEEDNARLDRGVGNYLRQADLQLSADFLPISGQQPPSCSFVLFDTSSGQSRGPCARPAKHAKMVIERWSTWAAADRIRRLPTTSTEKSWPWLVIPTPT